MPDALETALRELREPATPEFAAELDARVARGFDAPPRPRRTGPRFPRLRRLLVPAGGLTVACLVVLALVVAVRSLPSGEDTSASSGSGSSGAASATSASAPAAPGLQSLRSRPRRVERTAALTLAAPPSKIEDAAAGISGVADRFGGYVESSTVDAGGGRGGGDFVLRLPVRRLDGAMAALARLGEVRSRRQTAEDVTTTHDRARSALAGARAERTALLRRLAAATTDAQTASLRARLRDADAAIDRALTAVRRVDRRAAYARVDVTLVARRAGGAAPEPDGSWGPGAAWHDARRVLEVAAGVAVVTAAVLLPLLLLAVLSLTARRLLAARARERILDGV